MCVRTDVEGAPMWLSLGRDRGYSVPQVYQQGSYTDIRAHISACEVSLSGGCLFVSGSCVSHLRATYSAVSESFGRRELLESCDELCGKEG